MNDCVLFRSDKISGCYGNFQFPKTYKWELAIAAVSLETFEIFLQKC